MKLTEMLDLVGVRRRSTADGPRALRQVFTTADLGRKARRALPKPVVDYLDGGSDAETSLAANEAAFRDVRFRPAALRDVTTVDTATTFLGSDYALPLGLAPTGYTRMISPLGETAVLNAATRARVPYVLSTMATTTIEELARTSPRAEDLWFQLYVLKDRGMTHDMVRRAADAGSPVLEIAVDTAVSGNRLRDRRNGLTIPPRMTLSTLFDIGLKPGYWARMSTQPALDFSNIRASDTTGRFSGGSIADISAQFDPAVTWDDVARIRELWPNKLVLKGTLGAVDAATAVSLGVDGIHLSNHGGRQLDQAVPPVHLIRGVREAVGQDVAVLVDSGVRTGTDIAICLALGADAAFIGRPYLWALSAAGEAGVDKVIGILGDELRRTMALLGVTSIAELRDQGAQLLEPGRS
ncbi:alpha-hydroxy acid oxidase [Mycetocola sp. 2940]|uniref:alpha-hydroxy acid oxidase n=1 Tax=Mycetocola sp. 2940 TaxID=3156452 RepID=UPI003391E993